MANVVEIIIKQSGSGSAISTTVKELGGLDKAASSSIGTLGRFGGALTGMFTVAGGIVVANVFGKIADGISSLISTGLDAVGSNQQLETSLKSLLTANHMYAETTETMTVAVGNLVEMQSEAAKKSDDLAFKQRKLTAEINTQNASIQEQRQRIIQMADGLDKTQQVARLQEMEIALEGMNRELSETITEQGELNNITQEYETITKTSIKTVMSQADAYKLASRQTQDLLDFVSKLAVVSPFETQTVEDVTKYAIAAGMGVDATKDFVPAFLDLAASVGITSESLGFAADQLFQVKKIGKLTEVDLRQLRRIGIDLSKVIGVEMGMSVEEFNAAAEKSPAIFDELFAAVTRFSQNTFAGTSQEMATSVKGLQSTISDIFVIGSRTFMRPLVDAVTPAVSEIIGRLSDFVLGGDLAGIGQQFADTVAGWMTIAQEAIGKVMGAFDRFGVRGAGVSLLGILGFSPEQVGIAMGVADQIVAAVTRIQTAFELFGARGAAFSIMGLLGLDSDTMVTINTTIETIITTLTNFGTQVAGVLSQISFGEILGGLAGIAAVLAGGVVMGLVTGLMALLTPVNLLIAGAALLGAAWAGNWGGIQEKTGAVIAYVTEQVNTLIAVLTPAFESIWNSVNRVSEAFGGAGANTATLTTALGAIGVFLVDVAIPAFVQLAGVLADTLAMQIRAITDGVIAGHNAWVTFSGFIQSDVVPALLSINSGISTVTSVLIPLGELINTVINKALEAMAGLWQNVLWPALVKVGNLLKDTIMPTFTSLGETVNEDISPSLKDFGEVVLPLMVEGMELINEAIQRTISYFESLKSTVEGMIIPDWLQRHSPPPLALALTEVAGSADMAAAAMGGLGQSFSDARNISRFIDDLDMGGFAQAAGTGGGQWRNFRNIIKNQIGSSFEQLMTSGMSAAQVMAQIQQTAARFNFPPSFATEFAAANGLVEHLTSSVTEFQRAMRIENIGNMLQMGSQLSGIAGNFAGMLKEESSGQMDALKAFLESGEQTFRMFRELEGGGTSEFFWDRNRAQREYNLLLEQEERQQDLINQQLEQQQKLSFLQSQLDLIKLGRELGGNLFEGITFGLNASVEDLLAATNAVTEAMINQINADLQIASPSRVLFRMFRDQVGGAMAGGLMAARPMLQGIISPVLNPIMEGAAQAGRVVNNYFNQTVNTNAEQSTVIGDFRTMQLMAGS